MYELDFHKFCDKCRIADIEIQNMKQIQGINEKSLSIFMIRIKMNSTPYFISACLQKRPWV